MSSRPYPKELRALVDEAERLGFVLSRRRRHWSLTSPGGKSVTMTSSKASSHRVIRNNRAYVRRIAEEEGLR